MVPLRPAGGPDLADEGHEQNTVDQKPQSENVEDSPENTDTFFSMGTLKNWWSGKSFDSNDEYFAFDESRELEDDDYEDYDDYYADYYSDQASSGNVTVDMVCYIS